MRIVDSLNQVVQYEPCYVRNINCFVHEYIHNIRIFDLDHAGRKGEIVDRFCISPNNATRGESRILDLLGIMHNSPEDFIVTLKKKNIYKDTTVIIGDFKILRYEEKSYKVFNPLCKELYPALKAIPKIWTANSVVRALMNGQAWNLHVSKRFTDDYSKDDETNYGRKMIDIIEFCRDIVEDNDGWRFQYDPDIGILNATCYTFLYIKMEFNLKGTEKLLIKS